MLMKHPLKFLNFKTQNGFILGKMKKDIWIKSYKEIIALSRKSL